MFDSFWNELRFFFKPATVYFYFLHHENTSYNEATQVWILDVFLLPVSLTINLNLEYSLSKTINTCIHVEIIDNFVMVQKTIKCCISWFKTSRFLKGIWEMRSWSEILGDNKNMEDNLFVEAKFDSKLLAYCLITCTGI